MYIAIVDLFLVFWALWQFSSMRSKVRYRETNLLKPISKIGDYLLPSIAIGFLAKDWRSEFLCQSRLWRSQVWDLRRFLYSSAQALLSFFWLLLGFGIFYEISSYLVVAVAMSLLGVHWLISKALNQDSKMAKLMTGFSSAIFFSLVLFFLDLAFRNSTILMQFLMDTEIVFFTTIDSIQNILVLLLVSTFVSYFVPIQGWSLVLSFVFFLNSQLSYLGCAFIIVGEFLGSALYLYRRVRMWNKYYQKRIVKLIYWIFGYILVFLFSLFFLRQFVSFGNIFNQLFILKWIFLSTVLAFLTGLYLITMTWGHFAHANQEKDVAPSDSSLVFEFETEEMDTILVFIADQLRQRQDKLTVFNCEMDSDPQSKGKIPPFVLSQFQAEVAFIEHVQRVLLNRS